MDIQSRTSQHGIGWHDPEAKVSLGSLILLLAAINNGRITLGVDYKIGLRLPAMFAEAGFEDVELELAQPIYRTGANKQLWELTFRNAAPSLIAGGIATQAQVDVLFERMAQFAADETTWIAQVRAAVVTGRKPT